MSTLTDFFLNSRRSVVQLELLEIIHPSFSETFRICRNARAGVTVTYEDSTTHFHRFVPCGITKKGARSNLDTGIQVSLGDLGETIVKELDRVENDDSYAVKPIVNYRVYKSTDLANVLMGPFKFEVGPISYNNKGSTFEAAAPGLNFSKTGELYTIDRFPMLRGFL